MHKNKKQLLVSTQNSKSFPENEVSMEFASSIPLGIFSDRKLIKKNMRSANPVSKMIARQDGVMKF